MSPVTAPPSQYEKISTVVPDAAIEPVPKEEPKTHKKRKSEATNTPHVETVNQGADDHMSREGPVARDRDKRKKEKKEKKDKKDNAEKALTLELGVNGIDSSAVSQPLPAVGTKDEKPKKSKKDRKEKKDKHQSAVPSEVLNSVDLASSLPAEVTGDEVPKKSKKSKKEKKHKDTDMVDTEGSAPDAPIEAPTTDADVMDDGEEKKKKKKRKSEMPSGEPEVNGVLDATLTSTEKKSKKRKREAEEQEDVIAEEAASEKKKHKKKRVAVL
ncbi:hypothetical protein JB92DRAFT_3115768 [Gautieria morchelliformis]|nr:hypothetical protein JB92DRAFT_3115768 [Gautieria morchelliformis]